MRIYTRGGDSGKTALIGGERRSKHDARVEAYGSVDEAGAFIGLAGSYLDGQRDGDLLTLLLEIQQTLWDVGADLAVPSTAAEVQFRTADDAPARLEPVIDVYQAESEAVTRFIIRAGSTASAALHVACTVVRRAERQVVALMQSEAIHPPTLQYLNRLSDLLFVLARAVNAREQQHDIVYQHSPEVFR